MLVYDESIPKINRIAETKYGKLRGAWGDTPTYTVFRGVPYAKPPVGNLRWREPLEPDAWEGVRDALEFSGRSVQPDDTDENSLYRKEFYANVVQNSEDCLYLNIWTPKVEPGANYPVMFWVHGGGLHGGMGFEPQFDGEGFCRNGVILVTINYRLGLMGFYANSQLSAESEHHVSGNYGYFDQIAALRWVKENIYCFGGDPDNITVFGQSAGAGSVMNLVTSPLSKHLMSKAIIQSGVSVFKFGADRGLAMGYFEIPTLEKLEAMGDEFMCSLGCETIDEMRKIPAVELMTVPGMGFGGKYTFAPCIDGYMAQESVPEAMGKGKSANIPYLIGYNSDESSPDVRIKTVEDFEKAARRTFGDSADEFLKFADVKNEEDVRRIVFEMDGYNAGGKMFGVDQTRDDRKDVYLYYFSRQLPGSNHGAFHSSEQWYMFNSLRRCWRPMTGVDYDLAATMNKYWANFAKYGNPNGEGLLEWKCFSSDYPCEMQLDLTCGLRPVEITPVQKYLIEYVKNR